MDMERILPIGTVVEARGLKLLLLGAILMEQDGTMAPGYYAALPEKKASDSWRPRKSQRSGPKATRIRLPKAITQGSSACTGRRQAKRRRKQKNFWIKPAKNG